MNSIRIGAAFVRTGGLARFGVQAASVALVAGLALVGVTVLRFSGGNNFYQVSNLLADGGVRPGYLFGLALICLIPLTLFLQVVRLGAAARSRRFSQLRLAGASPAQLRAVAAVEVAVPSVAGAVLGWPAFAVLRHTFGPGGIAQWASDPDVRRELILVAPGASVPWWQVLGVIVGVSVVGVLVGTGVDRQLIGAGERSIGLPPSAPRLWPALGLLCLGPALIALYADDSGAALAGPSVFLGITGVLAGLLLGARRVAWSAARVVAARARSADLLLAANRIIAESGRAGRAGATVGAVALVAGGGSTLAADLAGGTGTAEALYVVPTVTVFVVIAVSLVVLTFSLAAHSVEMLDDRRRSTAALVAGGTPLEVLERALRWETALVAGPVSVLGLLLGAIGPAPFIGDSAIGLLLRLLIVAGFLGLLWLGIFASTRMVRPWLLDAADPANLRAT